jgi:hypothetical protein
MVRPRDRLAGRGSIAIIDIAEATGERAKKERRGESDAVLRHVRPSYRETGRGIESSQRFDPGDPLTRVRNARSLKQKTGTEHYPAEGFPLASVPFDRGG